jgi:hypothetical protein
MGMEGLAFGGVTTFLAEFFGSGIVASGLQAMLALAIGGLGLAVIIRAFSRS